MKEQIIQHSMEIYEGRVNVAVPNSESASMLVKNIIKIYSSDTKRFEDFIENTSGLEINEAFEFDEKNKLVRRYGK